jgi:hypothetical protein
MKNETELGQGRTLSSNTELLQWLDRNQKTASLRKASTNVDHELGFASIFYQTCLQLFGEIWKSLNKDHNRTRVLRAAHRYTWNGCRSTAYCYLPT